MKKKISTAVVGLSVLSFGLFGVNIGDGGVVKAAHGDTPAPKLDSHGDSWAPAYDHGRPPISSNNKGDTWAPKQETHADLSSKLDSHADTWAPAFNIGDTPAPKLEGHEHFPAPKLEAHGETI
ncbi:MULTISPECIES: hypothetical protein [Bacillus]|uniref:Methionyl-tRNA formyltransferase n=2 Tax=Bacillus cereus group TaxID=86661 RepID=A0A164NIS2_BACCE|nr:MULTISPECIES: hypothetical protein [Bacillus]KZD64260.1 Methionyl-tRNA formyltransferase [Bacillus cereus]TSI22953.1 hypothetical protein FOT98_00245 [Bacillus sp. HY001]SME43099.1 hypothetical protein BACERE00185_04824 [Bacillus mobilis]